MPLFGISRTVKSEGISGRFSLAFDEGLHALPQVEGKNLETLVVTFLYSKSGNGVIHSVSAQTIYKSSAPPAEIQIEYKWVEEEPVDIQSGATVMFLATLVVSVVFLFQACGLTSDDEDGIANGNHASEFSDSNIPKWGHSE